MQQQAISLLRNSQVCHGSELWAQKCPVPLFLRRYVLSSGTLPLSSIACKWHASLCLQSGKTLSHHGISLRPGRLLQNSTFFPSRLDGQCLICPWAGSCWWSQPCMGSTIWPHRGGRGASQPQPGLERKGDMAWTCSGENSMAWPWSRGKRAWPTLGGKRAWPGTKPAPWGKRGHGLAPWGGEGVWPTPKPAPQGGRSHGPAPIWMHGRGLSLATSTVGLGVWEFAGERVTVLTATASPPPNFPPLGKSCGPDMMVPRAALTCKLEVEHLWPIALSSSTALSLSQSAIVFNM